MSLSAGSLTTVANVQEIVGTGYGTARCERVIEAVSKAMARYCDITWEYSTGIVEFLPGTGLKELYLHRRNIVAVTSIYIWGEEQTLDTLDSSVTPDLIDSTTVYRNSIMDEKGLLLRPAGWPIGAATWPDLTRQPAVGAEFRQANIRVIYDGGYVTPNQAGTRTLPYDLEEACLREVTGRLVRPVGNLIAERTPGGWSQQWRGDNPSGKTISQFSMETLEILSSYVREWF